MPVFISFIAIVLTVVFFCHWFLYETTLFFFHLRGTAAVVPLRIFYAAMPLLFFLAFRLASRDSSFLVRALYTATASWLGFMDFLVLASVSLWVLYAASRIFPFLRPQRGLAAVFFGLAILVGIYGIINAALPRVTRITVKLPHLPPYWRGKTAVWVSDLHLGAVRGYGFAQEIAGRIQELKPDIVFIGGDLFDGGTIDLDEFTVPFSRLSAPDGIYFITGNHEEFSNPARYLQAVKQAGITILDNQVVDIKGLELIGVDYRDSANRQHYKEILKGLRLNGNLPSILLKHSPVNLDVAEKRGISLELSGHTHEGQIFPGDLFTSRVYHGYDYGLKRFGSMQIYTSSGVGTWGPPMRVGSRPEIVVIKLEPASRGESGPATTGVAAPRSRVS